MKWDSTKIVFLFAVVTISAMNASATPLPCKQGGIVQAIGAAHQDFYSFLRHYSGAPTGKLKAFLVNIDNYEVRAMADGDNYIVKFVPFGYSGGVVKGAGAKYTINKCTLKLDDIQGKQPIE